MIKLRKRVLSILLTVVMVLGLVCGMGKKVYAYSPGEIEGTTGSGTESDPVIIDTFQELKDALEYDGTLYIKMNKFQTNNNGDEGPFYSLDQKDMIDQEPVITQIGTKYLEINTTVRIITQYLSGNIPTMIEVMGDLTISGSGKLIGGLSGNSINSVLLVRNKGHLVCDGPDIGVQQYIDVSTNAITVNGDCIVNSGVIYGFTSKLFYTYATYDYYGAGVYVQSAGKLTVNGGYLSVRASDYENPKDYGLEISGTAILSGGTYEGIRSHTNNNISTYVEEECIIYDLSNSIVSGETKDILQIVTIKNPNKGITGDCTWRFDKSTGTLTISGNGAMANYSSADSSPWYSKHNDIKNLVIEDGVTTIGNYAFCTTRISSVTIPDSVKSIGDGAFLWNTNLSEVNLGGGVTNIGKWAFALNAYHTGDKLTGITIPSNVTSLSKNSFGYRYIYDQTGNYFEKIEGFTITGQCGSEANKYAQANEFTWISNEHAWDEGVVTKEATCKEKGIKTYTCVCGETKIEEIELKPHTLTKVPAKAATESEEGNKEYYICSVCNKWFEDAAGTKEITDHNSVIIPKLATATPTPDITRDANDISPSNPVKVDEIEKTILSIKDEKDTAGSTFTLLKAKGTPKSKKSIKLFWAKVPGAEEYIIYGNKCGKKNKYQKIDTVKGTSYTAKKLKKGTYYKYTIVAVKGDEAIATSKTIHVTTDGGKKGNNTKVKLSKTKLSLAAGKSKKIKATLKYNKKVASHRKVAWESDNVSVATVKNGKITAVGKGTCYVYAYAQNGVSAKIKVTVK